MSFDEHDTQQGGGTQPVRRPDNLPEERFWQREARPTPPSEPRSPFPPPPPMPDPRRVTGETRPPVNDPRRDPRAYPPPGGHVQRAPAGDNKRKRRPRRDNALYLPVWSVVLMLIVVIGVAGGVIALVAVLGGNNAPDGDPVFVIVTAEPSATGQVGATENPAIAQRVTPAPDSLGSAGGQTGATQAFTGPLPTFALEGPTLPPVILSPTPLTINIGANVIVQATDGLNVRETPGLTGTILFRADDQAVFNVVGGPEAADSITWWRLQDPTDASRVGWAAADYLEAQAAVSP
jgi:hypothetical protein